MTHHTCYPFGSECPICDKENLTVPTEVYAKVVFSSRMKEAPPLSYTGIVRKSDNGDYLYIGDCGSIPMHRVVSMQVLQEPQGGHFVCP
jgi:hypothetical protein